MKMAIILDRHSKTVRLRTLSDRTSSAIMRVRILADNNLKSARDAYKAEFGFEVKDKCIDREVADQLSRALALGKKLVAVPVHIALALWLREGGGGRTKGALSETPFSKDRKRLILQKVRARILELQGEGLRAGWARERAAEELSPGAEFPASAIIEAIKHPSGKRKQKNQRATG